MYKNTGKQHDKPILWGGQASFYTGKARSYLIKKGVQFTEIFRADPRFSSEIAPRIGYFVIPVLELNDGTLIQDTTDIILHHEQRLAEPALIPQSPVQNAAAWLLGFFGSECLWKLGLHYRWSYLNEQLPFLVAEFGRSGTREKSAAGRTNAALGAMTKFASKLPDVGVTPQTIPVIEAAYVDLLDVLEEHFFHYPYLLGGRPSLADFGLVAPMYAHLARDPVPGQVMKMRAPNVYRWTERMFQPGFADGEFPDMAGEYLPNDQLPATLKPILKFFFTEYEAELMAMLNIFNTWCAEDTTRPAGTPIRPSDAAGSAHPSLGYIEYNWRGMTHRRRDSVDCLYHLQRVHDVLSGFKNAAADQVNSLIRECGGQKLMATPLSRRIACHEYQFVLAAN